MVHVAPSTSSSTLLFLPLGLMAHTIAEPINLHQTMKLHHQPWKFTLRRPLSSSLLAHPSNTTTSSLSPISTPTAISTSASATSGPTPAPPRATTPRTPSASFLPHSPTHSFITTLSPALSGDEATTVSSCFAPQGKQSPLFAPRRTARLSR